MIDRDKQYKRQHQWIADSRDRVELLIPKGMKAEWKEKAEAEGLTVSQWVVKNCQGN